MNQICISIKKLPWKPRCEGGTVKPSSDWETGDFDPVDAVGSWFARRRSTQDFNIVSSQIKLFRQIVGIGFCATSPRRKEGVHHANPQVDFTQEQRPEP